MAERPAKKPKLINDFFKKCTSKQKSDQGQLNELECPVCLKKFFGLQNDFCEKGHGLCPQCQESLKSEGKPCPICHSSPSEVPTPSASTPIQTDNRTHLFCLNICDQRSCDWPACKEQKTITRAQYKQF